MPAASPTETTREGLFASTRWTMVLDAGESQTPPAQALSALSELCRIYWRPIFLFLRRQGSNPHDAQDLTQGFFAHLIESRAYARADPEKGRFRSFLLGALKHFVAHARAHDRTQKRGGGMILGQLDTAAIAEADARAVSLQTGVLNAFTNVNGQRRCFGGRWIGWPRNARWRERMSCSSS